MTTLSQFGKVRSIGSHRAESRAVRVALGALLAAVLGCPPPDEPEVATSLRIAVQPGGALSAAPLNPQPRVEVIDQDGELYSNGVQQVTVTLASGTGTLGGTTRVTAASGVAQFSNLTVLGGGTYTLQFSASGLTSATSQPVTIAQVPAAVAISTQPGGAVSGLAFTQQPVIAVRDAADNVVVGSTAPVTAAISTGSGSLLGTATVNAVNGVATFTGLRIDGRGDHVVAFSTPGLPSVASSSLTVTQTAASLAVSSQPSSTATSGDAFAGQPVVAIRDHAGLVVFGNAASVVASIATGTGTLAGTTTTNAVNGVATFSGLRINGAGVHTLSFNSTGLPAVTSGTVTVAAGAPVQLVLATEPGQSVSGNPLGTQPVVQLRDATNLLATGSTATVTAAISSGTGSLVGTTSVAAVGGVATFTNLRVDGAGAHVLTFSVPGLPSLASSAFGVTQVATGLQMVTQPGGAADGFELGTAPVVRVVDQAGLPILSGAVSTPTITAAKATGGGSLHGTTAVSAVAGTATFDDLSIAGTGAHSLAFSAAGVAGVTSAPFDVAGPSGMEVRVGSISTARVNGGGQLSIPISVDLSARGSQNLASLTVTVAWDPTRFSYVGNAAGGWADSNGDPATVVVNTASTASGTIMISGFTTSATLASFVLRTITLQVSSTGSTSSSNVTATVSASGNEAGAPVTVSPRNLTVTVSP